MVVGERDGRDAARSRDELVAIVHAGDERNGAAQSQITDANSAMSSQMTLLQQQVDSLDNVNSYSVATQLSTLQTQLETAYQLTAQISQLSLAKFLPVA